MVADFLQFSGRLIALFWLAALCICSCTKVVTGVVPQCPEDGASIDWVCFDTTSVSFKVVAKEGETATLRCVVRNLKREVVSWMRNDGRDIPLTVDTLLFAADKTRMRLNVSQSDSVWEFIIEPVKLSDAGQYLCQVDLPSGIILQDYALIVEESDRKTSKSPSTGKGSSKIQDSNSQQSVNKRLLSDDQDSRGRGGQRPNSVSIAGDAAVFSGTRHFPLTCTVRFASRDAKAMMTSGSAAEGGSRRLHIEWYHGGARQTTEPGAVDISLSWADSDTAVSVLTIGQVRPTHRGEWLCLKRQAEFGSAMETATHNLEVLIRDTPHSELSDSSRATRMEQLSSASLGAGIAKPNRATFAQQASSPLLFATLSVAFYAVA